MLQSTALEANLASFHVEVEINPRYAILQEVFSRYYGLMEGLTTFLKELSHPRRNLQFIVGEARGYALNYFHLIKAHPSGPEAVRIFTDIFLEALDAAQDPEVRCDAVDNLVLFLKKAIRESGPALFLNYQAVIGDTIARIEHLDDDAFFLFVKSYYRLEQLGEGLIDYSSEIQMDLSGINRLLFRYYRRAFAYWLAQDNPLEWFRCEVGDDCDIGAVLHVFDDISHVRIAKLAAKVEEIVVAEVGETPAARDLYRLSQLLVMPGYNAIVEVYREAPRRLLEDAPDQRLGNQWKVIFLFHIMNISGLSLIHEEALRDINRTISWLITKESHTYIEQLIRKTFTILKTRTAEFPATALSCILNMGKGVYKTTETDLINCFIQSVIDLGFQAPMIKGVGNDWQIRVNPAHILNIRAWMELIELDPKWSTPLLSALTIHLAVSGVFIRDTDLFPRDITRLLNSDIRPVYNLVKQLCRLFPVYFNDIGAEGDLRDISTRVDEICRRKDRLVHFLRKQVHVEGSSRVVSFAEAVIRFWRSGDKSVLEPFLPPMIFDQVDASGTYVDGMKRVLESLGENEGMDLPGDLLTLSDEELTERVAAVSEAGAVDRERILLTARLYKLLHYKYNLVMGAATAREEIRAYLAHLRTEAFPPLEELEATLDETDIRKRLDGLLGYLEKLKELILSERRYDSVENIYKKRHFTVDIPSMYGSYHEMKFDALGLAFRLESVVNVCFDELVSEIDLGLITRQTFHRVRDMLKQFYRAIKLDGISSVEMEGQLEILNHALVTRGFTFTQYLDIFKGMARAVKNAIADYFNNIHQNNLKRILDALPPELILERYAPHAGYVDPETLKSRVLEIFFRERISHSLGLTQLDLLLTRVMHSLYDTQSYNMDPPRLRLLLNYDHKRAVASIHEPVDEEVGIIQLGNKGNNLLRLNRMGLPVPPGFVITTEVFRCWQVIEEFPHARENFNRQLRKQIDAMEKRTGKRFGNPDNPLLFSVRSGSTISQPGMMDTFLNVGMNEAIAEGLAIATGNTWFAWDNFRRYIQCFGMSFGISRNEFDGIMNYWKSRFGVNYKRELRGDQMRVVALDYRHHLEKWGIRVPDDPFEQLHATIRKVMGSWESEKARAYRRIMGISDDWGTAVTIQAMIYGNISNNSGTGVFFTHNPRWSEDSLRLWGDFSVGNQGEDVVAGLVETLPISISQQENEKRDTDVILETHFPQIYKALKEWASDLIHKHGWSPQEIEFTFESPNPKDLYLLQTRNMAMRERGRALHFAPEAVGPYNVLLGNGIGVSGGAMSGRAVFTLEEIGRWRREEPGTSLILIRGDTVPDDIREIDAADGLLTARGGVTSHASVVAHRLGKTCVVGCARMVCDEAKRTARFDDRIVLSGDFLSIDGQEGVVYAGSIAVEDPE